MTRPLRSTMLKEIAPRITRTALLANPKLAGYDYLVHSAEAAAPSLAIELVHFARGRRRGDRVKRRDFITLLGGAAAAWPLAARAQQPDRMRRIGVLMSFAPNDPEAQSRTAALEHRLRELGWVIGRNLRIEYRWADNDDVLRTHATELIGMEPDLILASSTPIMAALQKQRHSVPIVFTQVTDPVGQGLVSNLAHPGGHLTGFTSFELSIGTKWLETLKEVTPRVTRIALWARNRLISQCRHRPNTSW
jgi:ABC-type uncharacterized transport system substrate-binding protein